MKYIIYTLLLSVSFGLTGCMEPDITVDLLEGDVLMDASINQPEKYLVSAKYPSPTATDLSKHIILAIHGYSASTFEWDEFRAWSDSTGPYRISQVLLAGHGTTYEEFKSSTWKDWRSAITEEYEKLEALGYTKISLVGSSTGGPLLLEMVSSGYFDTHTPPKNIFLIDPIVVSSTKLQSIAGIVGPMLGYVSADTKGEEKKYWYSFRPQETIRELNAVMDVVKMDLQKGFSLPTGTYLKSFHSKNDPTASSTSTVLIYKGLTTSSGNPIDVEIMESDIHVFTRLNLRRTSLTELQIANQEHAFNEMKNRLD